MTDKSSGVKLIREIVFRLELDYSPDLGTYYLETQHPDFHGVPRINATNCPDLESVKEIILRELQKIQPAKPRIN